MAGWSELYIVSAIHRLSITGFASERRAYQRLRADRHGLYGRIVNPESVYRLYTLETHVVAARCFLGIDHRSQALT